MPLSFETRGTLASVADHSAAICLVLLSMAGALRVVFDLGYGIYYVAMGGLTVVALFRCGLALRVNQWHVAPFPRLLSALGLNKRFAIYLLLYYSLFAWLMISALWTTAPAAMWKEDLFYIVVLVSVITLTGLCITHKTAKRVLLYWVAGAMLVTLYVLKSTMGAATLGAYLGALKNVQLTLATPQGMALGISFFIFTEVKPKQKKSYGFF